MAEVNGSVLLIAGSDSSGGAGLEADQKVLAVHGVYSMTATTALTAQNPKGVQAIEVIPPSFLRKQIDANLEAMRPDVVKIGMLSGTETITIVAKALKDHHLETVVLDPVMVATSGAKLLSNDAVADIHRELLPVVTILTPNVPEAQLILKDAGKDAAAPQCLKDLENLGRKILELGPQWVLVKGGHSPLAADGKTVATTEADRKTVVDVLVGHKENSSTSSSEPTVLFISSSYVPGNFHGTGCSLASAIAAGLAKGMQVSVAVKAACAYVQAGIKSSAEPGLLNYYHNLQILPFTPGHFVDYLLSRDDVKLVWDKFLYHPFVMALGNDTLPLDSFKNYLIQDYLYLIHFARANALASYKTTNVDDIAACASIVTHITVESKLHLDYCKEFGISKEEILKIDERRESVAYTRYILDVGMSEDWIALQFAMAPCLLGYGAVGQMLASHSETKKEGNRYQKWMDTYVSEDFVQAVEKGKALLEKHAPRHTPSRIEELVKIFIKATRMEIGFWEMYPAS